MIMEPLHGHVGAVAPVNVHPLQPGVLLPAGGQPPSTDVGGDGLGEQVLKFGQIREKIFPFLFFLKLP